MAKKSNHKQHSLQGKSFMEQFESLQSRVEEFLTSGINTTIEFQENISLLLLYSMSSIHKLTGKVSECTNLAQRLSSKGFNSRVLDPSTPLKIVINDKGLNPPFVEDLTTIDSILNMNLEDVRKCLDHYGCQDDDLKRTALLEAVGVDTRRFINDGNSNAKSENSFVLGPDKTLILLRGKEGNYPSQGTLVDGRKVISLSELKDPNNSILEPLLQFYEQNYIDLNFEKRIRLLLLILGYPADEDRLAKLEKKLEDVTKVLDRRLDLTD